MSKKRKVTMCRPAERVQAASIQQHYTLFIENAHEHAGKITTAITGRWPDKLGSVPARSYHLPLEQIEAN